MEFGIINQPQSGLSLNAMTPKEKASELVKKYYIYSLKGKECATIAVDEILLIDCWDMSEENFVNHIEYWEQVKQEIQDL
jgi:hypothetical protein